MILTKEDIAEMCEAAKPLQEFLKEHGDPHCSVTVDSLGITAKQDVAYVPQLISFE